MHPKATPPRKGGAYNSITVDKDTPHFNTPLSPMTETTVNMPQSNGLSSDTTVQDIMANLEVSWNSLEQYIVLN